MGIRGPRWPPRPSLSSDFASRSRIRTARIALSFESSYHPNALCGTTIPLFVFSFFFFSSSSFLPPSSSSFPSLPSILSVLFAPFRSSLSRRSVFPFPYLSHSPLIHVSLHWIFADPFPLAIATFDLVAKGFACYPTYTKRRGRSGSWRIPPSYLSEIGKIGQLGGCACATTYDQSRGSRTKGASYRETRDSE